MNKEVDLEQTMDQFLASVEQIGYRIAYLALSSHDDALDVVQDSMIKLVKKYAQRPPGEWRTLFFTILNNRVKDFHRRNSLKGRLFGWFDNDEDLQQAADTTASGPARQHRSQQTLSELEQAVQQLPLRQQQAFMLRMVDGLDTNNTAKAMGCTAGSVKTHLSRALSALKTALEEHYEPA